MPSPCSWRMEDANMLLYNSTGSKQQVSNKPCNHVTLAPKRKALLNKGNETILKGILYIGYIGFLDEILRATLVGWVGGVPARLQQVL